MDYVHRLGEWTSATGPRGSRPHTEPAEWPETIFACAVGATPSCLPALLIAPALGSGIALQDKDTPLWVFQLLALLSGFAAAFPLVTKVIFGYSHVMVDGVMTHDTINPNGPSALMYAWMGPFIGALIRPVGGWIADRIGGALVTQVCAVIMVVSALCVVYYMKAAYASASPEDYFAPFFLLFLTLFAATGIGNGSTFRTIAMVFPKEPAGPVLGWTSAVAAYGASYIPKVFGEQIKATTPEYALAGFAIFYVVCLAINYWYYLRKNGEFYNP